MMKTIEEILDMLGMFYANKHLHDKVKRYRRKHNIPEYARVTKW